MLTALFLASLWAADEKEAEEAIDRFQKAYRDPNPTARAAAVTELSRTPHEKTLKKLAGFLMQDVPQVRVAAAKGLGNFKDYKKMATPVLVASLGGPNQKEYDVQAAIFEGLGLLRDETALGAVHGNFRAEHIKVAKAAVASAGAIRHRDSIDALIELIEDLEKWLKREQSGPYRDDKGVGDKNAAKSRLTDLQGEVIKAFQSITKEKWTTAQEWKIWWGKRKATFKVPD
jgi:HEAT repeat protein